MHYVMSDIHGQYDQYIKLLKKINFNDNDVLYVLGDVVDRGPHPIKILQDMMLRFNVYPLIGNHEYMFLEVLQFLMNEITEESVQELEDHDERLEAMQLWLEDGGKSTLDEFMQLSREEMYDIMDYLEEFIAYEEVKVNNNDFILVHAGLDNFSKDRSLDSYDLYELIFERIDYLKQLKVIQTLDISIKIIELLILIVVAYLVED